MTRHCNLIYVRDDTGADEIDPLMVDCIIYLIKSKYIRVKTAKFVKVIEVQC